MSNRHSRPTLGSLTYWIVFRLMRSVAFRPVGPRHEPTIRARV